MPHPVVLIHGLRTSSSMWDPQVERLTERGWRCVTPDLPGHGRRSAEAFTLDGALSTIRDTLTGVGRAHLVGCSLGGMVAIEAASQNQDRVVSLIAAGCSVQPTRLTASLYGFLIGAFDRLGEGPLRRLLGTEGAQSYLRGGRAGMHVASAGVRAVADTNLLAALRTATFPVAMLNGRLDQFRLQERRFAAAAPRGRLVVLPYGSHLVNLTHPGPYTDVLERLLLDAEALSASQ